MKNNQGSKWNIWDLHIHTPKSIVSNYGGDTEEVWEKFITNLESLPSDVKVLGINDYYFIDGYKKVMDFRKNGRLKNFDIIFPVIEFRIDTFASGGGHQDFSKINLHVLFDIDEKNLDDEIQKIETQFINQLKLSSLPAHQTQSLTYTNLLAASPDGTIQTAFSEIIPSTNEIFKLIESSTWKSKIFVFLGYKEWDNLDKNCQLKQHKQHLFDKADAFFTASPSCNMNKKEQILNLMGTRPLLHSLDIHDFSQLSESKYKCFTWIKGNPTFDGLCQIKYEPNERISLSSISPSNQTTKRNIVETIQLSNSGGWFLDEPLELNSGLIAIIGEKGAGKTALLDIIAVCSNEGIYESDSSTPSSFYFRTKKDSQLKEMKVLLKYAGDESIKTVDFSKIDVKYQSNKNAKVRYLSLKELENYSSNKTELQVFLQGIINDNDIEISTLRSTIESEISSLKKANEEISKLEDSLINKPLFEQQLVDLNLELEQHNKIKPDLNASTQSTISSEYSGLLTEKSNIDKNTIVLSARKKEIEEYRDWVKVSLIQNENSLKEYLLTRAREFNYVYEIIDNKLEVKIETNLLPLLESNLQIVQDSLVRIGDMAISNQKNLEPYNMKNKEQEDEAKLLTTWLDKNNKLEHEKDTCNSNVERLTANSTRLIVSYKERRTIFKTIIENKLRLKAKFIDLKNKIDEGQISFSVSINFDEEKFKEKEDNIISHTYGHNKDRILRSLKPLYMSIVDKLNSFSESDTGIDDAISSIENVILKDDNLNEFLVDYFDKTVPQLLKKSFSMNDFYNFIFDDYYCVLYDIKYNKKLLKLLSPGQKGLVLLKLLLRLDKSANPLLIDQPEDNLDNKSVFVELKDEFREVKKRRQIIIATHNPNLVVNTDAEQIIIAKFKELENLENPSDFRIEYISGGLEDEYIRKEVCSILEGGDDAFRKRELRYNPIRHN